MSDGFVRINLAQLYPPFAQRVMAVQAACAAKGAHYYMTSGYRSWLEQTMLYAQGRTKPGKVVTNAKPGSSLHNFGLAVDFTLDADLKQSGLQPDWRSSNYSLLGVEAQAAGLIWGGSWTSIKDFPHVEFPLPTGVTLGILREWYGQGGIEKVWSMLDSYQAKG